MSVDGANLQGANLRQVVVQADTAALSIRLPPPLADSPVRPLAQLGERLQVERNQSVGDDLVVQRQEENPEYSAGDALNGDGRQEGGRGHSRRHGGAETGEEERLEEAEPWRALGDPGAAQQRLKTALDSLPFARVGDVFRSMDRAMLTGLMLPGAAPGGGGMATYQRQAMQVLTAVEAFRMAVHGALKAAEICSASEDAESRERARKLVSLARQSVRSESDVGRELSAFLDDALLEVSRGVADGSLRAVALLAIVDSAISLWREQHNVGTVHPWSLP